MNDVREHQQSMGVGIAIMLVALPDEGQGGLEAYVGAASDEGPAHGGARAVAHGEPERLVERVEGRARGTVPHGALYDKNLHGSPFIFGPSQSKG